MFSKGINYKDLNDKEVEVVFSFVLLSNLRCVILFLNFVIFLLILFGFG